MEEIKLKNDSGLELIVTTNFPEKYSSIYGGMDESPLWEEYVADYKDEFKPHLELIKKAIIELGWIGKTGAQISNYYCFVFSDGNAFSFSWRAWGDLMSAIVGKKEGYIAYYM